MGRRERGRTASDGRVGELEHRLVDHVVRERRDERRADEPLPARCTAAHAVQPPASARYPLESTHPSRAAPARRSPAGARSSSHPPRSAGTARRSTPRSRRGTPGRARGPTKQICTTTSESLSAGPAVSSTLAYSSRGAPLTQSRKCRMSDPAVARWKRLEGRARG